MGDGEDQTHSDVWGVNQNEHLSGAITKKGPKGWVGSIKGGGPCG